MSAMAPSASCTAWHVQDSRGLVVSSSMSRGNRINPVFTRRSKQIATQVSSPRSDRGHVEFDLLLA